MPVPSVTMITRPGTSLAAPHLTSATPAASASLTAITGRPVTAAMTFSILVPIQLGSTLAAVRATPFWTTAGKVQPSGPCHPKWPTTSATALATASGSEGWGVGMLVALGGQETGLDVHDGAFYA